ncbi:MAG: hypothetical protein Q7S53_04410 [bacterium]|nr:hypothetical protein [bacterium]
MTEYRTSTPMQCTDTDCVGGVVTTTCPVCQGRDSRCAKCKGTGTVSRPCEFCLKMKGAKNSAAGIAGMDVHARRFKVPENIPES